MLISKNVNTFYLIFDIAKKTTKSTKQSQQDLHRDY